ncbi:MAG TPA: trypsin-like peptidase domain-containing protein, partial [Negativicutes bacterium]|nr:trypsin-like peptidase domain-containing protein [Negativicutes bacterium]
MKLAYKKYAPIFIIAVIGAIVGGGLVMGYGPLFLGKSLPEGMTAIKNEVTSSTANAALSAARNTPIVRAAQIVGPSVVGITNKAYVSDMFNRKTLVERGSGSGVIYDATGHIITNYHVVAEAQEIVVSLSDGRTMPGRVQGVDPATDLAVVKIEATGLQPARFGDSDSLQVGEPAIAVGNPLGLELKGSVTAGVISALNRTLDIGERRFRLIQTDAAINPGNSGGALANADGEVVGINSIKIAVGGVEGIGFAIPFNTAKPIIQSLIEKGRVVRPYLGVVAFDKASAQRYGYQLNIDKGLYVFRIVPRSPADRAGVRVGDVILKLAGQDTNSLAELRSIIEAQGVGATVPVVVARNGEQFSVQTQLSE